MTSVQANTGLAERSDAAQPRRARAWFLIRWAAACLLVATMVMPVYGCRANPQDFDPRPGHAFVRWSANTPDDVPVLSIAEEAGGALRRGDVVGVVWAPRRWYPYALVPFWLAAMWACARGGAADRRRWGTILRRVSIAVLVFEACYLARDFDGAGPRWLHVPEGVVVWFVIAWILLGRTRGDDGVETAVSSQALLSFCHALTFPVNDLWKWSCAGYSVSSMAASIGANYKLGFWIAAAAFLAAALPLRRGSRAAR